MCADFTILEYTVNIVDFFQNDIGWKILEK